MLLDWIVDSIDWVVDASRKTDSVIGTVVKGTHRLVINVSNKVVNITITTDDLVAEIADIDVTGNLI